MAHHTTHTPGALQEIVDDRLERAGVRLLLKRDDLLDADIPGNKFRKLKYNVAEILAQEKPLVLTFGGAYSNHIAAVAAAGERFGFPSVGVIRGEEHSPLNPVLQLANDRGMRFSYLDRESYGRKTSPEVVRSLKNQWGDFYLLPEGGSNCLALRGCAEIPGEIHETYDVICCPCGTGGTLAGIISALPPDHVALGFAVLKGGSFLETDVTDLLNTCGLHAAAKWSINTDFHFGGFAKTKPELLDFISDFAFRHNVQLDPIYTGKMMYGIFDLATRAYFAPGTTIVAVHTGGGLSGGGAHSSGST